ncbi:MAG TPA: hypothetical protein VHM28_05885 [Anaerolineales bacterium]|jgi:hypothetical protein|nr:hypothetical protein [Anaerolineales bacterium]
MDKLVVDILGWVGTICDLFAYYLVSTKRLRGDAPTYQLINLLGGSLLTVNAIFYHSASAIAVNIAWIGISILTLRRATELKSE